MEMKSNSALNVVRSAIGSYKSEAEEWKRNHHEAIQCYDFEDFLQVGIGLFHAITEFDERHRGRVLAGDVEFDPGHSHEIRSAYTWWLEPCDDITAHLTMLRQKFGDVKNAEEFLSLCREARGIVTDDVEFFSNEALVALRDEAIDEHKAGMTSECGSWK